MRFILFSRYWEKACIGRTDGAQGRHAFRVCRELDALAESALAADLSAFGSDGKADVLKFPAIPAAGEAAEDENLGSPTLSFPSADGFGRRGAMNYAV